MGFVRPLSALALLVACAPASKREPPSPPENGEAAARAATPARIANPLELVAGASVIFQGTWTSWDDDAGREIVTPLTWTMTVTEVKDEGGGRVVARVTGWPGDAPSAPDRETVIAMSAEMIRLGPDPESDWVRLPLRAGDQVCADETTYCWSVEATGGGHDVVLRTRPDVTIFHLEPGRGLTRFEYHHNGTTDDLVLERVE